ncbi:SRPBCC family protein [Paenibacillus alba]|uniref:SRPBCC family protein n=1 Tax=Paenibacillus alba TaxID=1197127 RepID=A0ABU6G872_9BACL|nr:SRPBCC family protein [Paenibacillus alba]MEC0230377.1 SRPBCC family protein [Paenibacillus alba]
MLDLKYELYINAKPEQVWEVFISPEGTKAIFFGCVLNSTFAIGSPYAYVGPGSEGDETVHVYGEVLEFEPNVKMSYTEHPGPSYRENHAELETRVTLTLDVVGNFTKLTLVNDQWPENHPSYESTQSSWPMILSNIKSYVETGKTLDFGW